MTGLTPLRRRDFRRLLTGSLASTLGDSFYAVALPWYVLAEHGGALLLGTVLAAYGIARAAALLAGGQLSDRLAPWSTMMGADAVRTLAAAALALAAALGPARAGLLIPISVVIGAGDGIFLPASMSIVPALLPDGELQAGNALASTAQQLGIVFVPLGGVLVAVAGAAPAIAADAASFLLSAISLAAVRRAARPGRAGAGEVPAAAGAPRRLGEILRTERVLALILLVTCAANLGSGGESEVALPALAHGPLHAGAPGYGLMLAAFGAGAVLGTLGAAHATRVARPALVASFVFLVQAGVTAAIPYLGGAAGAAGLLFAFGLCNGFANVLTITAFQRWCPRALLGRLMSVLMLASVGIFPLSVLLGGIIVHADGPAVFFPFAGAALAIAVLGALARPEWRAFGAAASGLETRALPA